LSSRSKRLNAQIREEASEWLVGFSEGEVDADGREAFTHWLRTSPEHAWAYWRVSAFWHDAELIDKATRGDIDSLVERAVSETNVVPLVVRLRTSADRLRSMAGMESKDETEHVAVPAPPPGIAERGAASFRRRTISGSISGSIAGRIAAALIIVCVGALFAVPQFNGSHTYVTGVGELRTVTLADGSRIELNARSRINVKFDDSQRYVELLEGQALFSVANDAARPFIVRSGSTDVKAVGTQFDVNRKPSGTVVTVMEGRVAVSQPARALATSARREAPMPRVLLSPGEQVTVTAHTIIAPKKANLAATTAWTEGLLTFDSAPLSEVVQEFNRHNMKPLVIADERLLELRISGIFPATGAQRLTSFLQQRFGIAVQEREDAIRLFTEQAPGSSEETAG
jgi:transmembrane sensor